MHRIVCSVVFLLFCASAVSPAVLQRPRWSLRIHPGLLVGLKRQDLTSGTASPLTVVERLKESDFTQKLEQFLDLCVQKAVSEIIVDGIQPELKGIYFQSERLESLGWKPLYDVLELLCLKSAEREIQVGISLTELGVQARGLYEGEFGLDTVRKLTTQDIEPLFRELMERYPLRTVSEEEFPASWFVLLQGLAQQYGFRYVHRANTDDIVSLTGLGQRTTPLDAYSGLRTLSSRDYFPLVALGQENGVVNGSFPLIFPQHRRLIETGPLSSGKRFMENLILFRLLQTAAEEITLLVEPDELSFLSYDLLVRAQQFLNLHDSSAPLLNLVVSGKVESRLDPGHVGWLHLVANLEPILLGVQAAGLRILISEAPLRNAAAYYLYLAGPEVRDWTKLENFFTGVEEKLVLVQLGGEISEELSSRVMNFLGIEKGQWRQGILSDSGLFRRREVAFKGIDLYQGNVPTGRVHFEPKLPHLIMADSTSTPLIYRHPQISSRFLLNGNLLHREMGFPISQLLSDGKAFQKPAICFIAMGKKTVFWALEDTEVDWINPRTGEEILLEMKSGGFYLK